MCIHYSPATIGIYHWVYVPHCKYIVYPHVLVLEQKALSQNGRDTNDESKGLRRFGGEVGVGPIFFQNTTGSSKVAYSLDQKSIPKCASFGGHNSGSITLFWARS